MKQKIIKIFNCLLIIFFVFWLLFLTNTEALSWNDKSRFSTIQNLVENKSFVINGAYYEPYTFDKVQVDLLFYSDKPPLLSVIASAPYYLLNKVGINFANHHKIATYTTNIFIILLPFLLFGLLLFRFINKYAKIEKQKAKLLTIALMVGTSLYSFSATLNNHQPATLLCAVALLILFFKPKLNHTYTALVAFLFSLASFIDLGAIFIAVPFTILVIYKIYKQEIRKSNVINKLATYLIFALIPLTIHYLINSPITGDILPPSMHPELFNYPNSPFLDQSLLTGANLAVNSFSEWLKYCWHLSFGKRGFLLHDPLVVIGLILAIYYAIKNKGITKLYSILTLISFLIVFIYYSLFGKNAGGVSYSVRWLVITIPLFFPIIIDWISKQKKRTFAILVIFCLLLSIINVSATGNVISSPNRFKRYSFINTTDNFPNYFWSQYTEWKRLIINVIK